MDDRYFDSAELKTIAVDPDSPGVLVREVLIIQAEHAQNITIELTDTDKLTDQLLSGQHITTTIKPAIEPSSLADLVTALAEAIRKQSPAKPDLTDVLPDDIETNDDIDQLVTDVLSSEPKLSALKLLTASLALTPWYMKLAQSTSEHTDLSVWNKSTCPVCGQPPVMGLLGKDDGARVLECWLCRAQWVFPRLQCPCCDNKEQTKLRLFTVNDEDARRVHICDECRHYVKVVDTRNELDVAPLALMDVSTVYQDNVALEEGWLPFARSPFHRMPRS